MANIPGQEPFGPGDFPFFMDPEGGGSTGGAGGPGGAPPPGPGIGGPGNFFGGRAQSLTGPVPGGYSPFGYMRNRLRPFGQQPRTPQSLNQQGGGYAQPQGYAQPMGGAAPMAGRSFGGHFMTPGRSAPGIGVPGNAFENFYDPQTGQWTGGTSENIMNTLLRRYAGGGGFDPMGDPRITAMLREQAGEDARAQQHAARVGLMGRSDVDPSTFGFQSLMGDLNSQSQVAQGMNAAQLQQALAMQQFYQSLFGDSALGTERYQQGRESDAHQGRIQRGMQPGFDWGGFLQGAGKTAAGFF